MEAIKALHTKLKDAKPVDSLDVRSAATEYGGMSDADKQANRATLVELRYRTNADNVTAAAKAELSAFQSTLPERELFETMQHTAEDAGNALVDAGGKAAEVGSDMFSKGTESVADISQSFKNGDIQKALTHPLSATILSAVGLTMLSNKILGTKTSWWKTLLTITGVTFAANMIQKYSH